MSITDAVTFAISSLPSIDPSDPDLVTLANCLGFKGSVCPLVERSIKEEDDRNAIRTGYGLGYSRPMSSPPSYGGGVYFSDSSRPWAYVGGKVIAGTTMGTERWEDEGGFVSVQVSELEATIKSMLNYFLRDRDGGDVECR
jgi:hypothetical protein